MMVWSTAQLDRYGYSEICYKGDALDGTKHNKVSSEVS